MTRPAQSLKKATHEAVAEIKKEENLKRKETNASAEGKTFVQKNVKAVAEKIGRKIESRSYQKGLKDMTREARLQDIEALDDLIETRRNFAKKTGYSLTRFTMNTETWEMVLKAEDTKKQVLGITAYNGGIRLQQSQVTEYLRGYGIEIEVYDKLYIDPADGQTKYFVPTGVVSAQCAGVYLGDYVFGKTPEERSGSITDGNLSIVETGISVYTYATNHPINTHCVVSMIGLPTFEGMDSVVVMKVA